MSRFVPLTLAILVFVSGGTVRAASLDNWSSWRGSSGLGHAPMGDYPVSWSDRENVAWKVALPDGGNSTPVVWGDKVFVTQAVRADSSRGLMCFEVGSGKLLWHKKVIWKKEEPSHKSNPNCSGSPVTDGKTIVAWFGSAGLHAYDFDGNELWRCDLGKQKSMFGYGSSPMLHRGVVYLNFGPGSDSFVVAIDLKLGEVRWRVPVTFENNPYRGVEGSYSTPLIVKNRDAVEELITTFPGKLVSLNPKTGEENWHCNGLDHQVLGSPASNGEVVVAMSGYKYKALATDMQGKEFWTLKTGMVICSPIIRDDYLYYVTNDAFSVCLELKTGKEVWRERLGKQGCWSSLILAGDKLYIVNKQAITYVFKASPTFELISTNETEGTMTNASLAFGDKAVYMRTHKKLWKFVEE